MATVKVTFIGICTQVHIPVGGWQHRVVLPVPFKTGIPEHHASLWVRKTATNEEAIAGFVNGSSVVRGTDTAEHFVLQLRGAELQVLETVGGLRFEDSFRCGVFTLSQYTGGPRLGNVDREVWDGRKSARAHAYFNVAGGTFSAERRGESSSALLEMPTNGGTATLEAKDFSTGQLTRLFLDGASQLEIRHTYPSHHDSHDDSHFKLHFELVEAMPEWPTFPCRPAPCLPEPLPDHGCEPCEGLGAGCSNSQFP
jgi:hypothetical protein